MFLKKLFAFLLMFMATAAWAAPNPAEYTVKVHVVSSHLETQVADKTSTSIQTLNVIIDGKKCELSGLPVKVSHLKFGLISPGDYPAKMTLNDHKGTYLYATQYELLFPDGKTNKFTVTGKTE